MPQIFSKLKFHTPTGSTSAVTISGINDAKSGTQFQPKAAIVIGRGTLNTTSINVGIMLGFSDLTTSRAFGTSESNDFGGKIIQGTSSSSPIFVPSGSIFGGTARLGSFSNVTSGAVDITCNPNYAGDTFAILFLGGSDFSAKVADLVYGSAAQTTTFRPEIVLQSSGGGGFINFGFGERNGATGAIAWACNSQGTSSRYQRTDKCFALLNSTPAVSFQDVIASWQSGGFTMGQSTGGHSYMALGGVSTVGGYGDQPTSTGTQTLATGLDPLALVLFSVGKTAGTSIVTGCSQWSMGIHDGSSVASLWTNEDLQGNASPVHGGRLFSDTYALQFCDAPAGAGSTIAARASVTGWNRSTGNITLNWSTVDAVARQYVWFAFGVPIVPTISAFGPLLGMRQNRLAR